MSPRTHKQAKYNPTKAEQSPWTDMFQSHPAYNDSTPHQNRATAASDSREAAQAATASHMDSDTRNALSAIFNGE